MADSKWLKLLIIDGQGGRIGKQLVEAVKLNLPKAKITAIGTNSLATSSMMKAGADSGATGENAVMVGCKTADIIIGPIGIVLADSLLGEITPQIAVAVAQSHAKKILIPINKCDHIIVGVAEQSVTELIEKTITTIVAIATELT